MEYASTNHDCILDFPLQLGYFRFHHPVLLIQSLRSENQMIHLFLSFDAIFAFWIADAL